VHNSLVKQKCPLITNKSEIINIVVPEDRNHSESEGRTKEVVKNVNKEQLYSSSQAKLNFVLVDFKYFVYKNPFYKVYSILSVNIFRSDFGVC